MSLCTAVGAVLSHNLALDCYFAVALADSFFYNSIIGNMTSLFVALYCAAIRAPKESVIATSLWLFFTMNAVKLPIHIWKWRTLTWEMLLKTLILIPLVSAGIPLGRVIVRRTPEPVYRRFAVVMVGPTLVRYLSVLSDGA